MLGFPPVMPSLSPQSTFRTLLGLSKMLDDVNNKLSKISMFYIIRNKTRSYIRKCNVSHLHWTCYEGDVFQVFQKCNVFSEGSIVWLCLVLL